MTTTERMLRLGWRGWLVALAKATIGGGATAAGNSVVMPALDPGHFAQFSAAWFQLVAWSFLYGSVLALVYFLKQSPFPDLTLNEKIETAIREEIAKS